MQMAAQHTDHLGMWPERLLKFLCITKPHLVHELNAGGKGWMMLNDDRWSIGLFF